MLFFFIILTIIILFFVGKTIYRYLYQKKINKIVELNISNDIIKKPFFLSNNNLNILKKKWTISYLKKKFNNQKILVTNIKNGILNYFEEIEDININSNKFFDLLLSKNGNKYYYAQNAMIESLKNDIFIPKEHKKYGKINDLVFWIGGGDMFTPLHFDHDDGFLCIVKGYKYVKLVNPKYTNLLQPYLTMMYSEYLDINKNQNQNIPFLEYELREGDCLFIPAGWWHSVKSSSDINIAYTIWLYPYDGKYNYDIVVKKIETLQKRKIPKYIYPKNLKFKEIKRLFNSNLLNEKQLSKNFFIFNPMYTDIYD